MNRYKPHVYVLPEDDRNRQLAVGFVRHGGVDERRIQIMPVAGGWSKVLDLFRDEYVAALHNDAHGYVVMLIDFDGCFDERRAAFDREIPDDLKRRVFVIGSSETPEDLRRELGRGFEDIGHALADECQSGAGALWSHDHLKHNDAELRRLFEVVAPILFS